MYKYILFFGVIFSLFSCTLPHPDSLVEEKEPSSKPIVFTSFYPLTFLAESLLGEQVQVETLVPLGGEPHDYEPSLSDIASMQKSDLVLLHGLGMESYEQKLIETLKTGKVLVLGEAIPNLIELSQNKDSLQDADYHDHGTVDPHTWISPKMYISLAEKLSKQLQERGFLVNENIIGQLKDLDNEYTVTLKNCATDEILTSHEAFAYLARDYGFKQHAIYGITPEQEPTSKDIKEIIDLIKKQKISYIFTEPLISPKFTTVLQAETNVKVLELHPLESLTTQEVSDGDTYLTLMKMNLQNLKIGLHCK